MFKIIHSCCLFESVKKKQKKIDGVSSGAFFDDPEQEKKLKIKLNSAQDKSRKKLQFFGSLIN